MAIVMKLKELLEAADAIRAFGEQKLPAKGAYRVSKLIRAADTEFRDFDQTRVKLVQALDLQPKEGEETDKEREARQERLKEFEKQFNALVDEDVQFDISKIAWDDIGGIEISPVQMMRLAPFIEEPAEPVTAPPLPKLPKHG